MAPTLAGTTGSKHVFPLTTGEIREIAKDRNILVQAEQGRLSLSNIYAETVYKGLELGWDATL